MDGERHAEMRERAAYHALPEQGRKRLYVPAFRDIALSQSHDNRAIMMARARHWEQKRALDALLDAVNWRFADVRPATLALLARIHRAGGAIYQQPDTHGYTRSRVRAAR